MKQMTKVIFIARRFPPSVGGMERFASDLAGSLSNEAELTKLTWGGSNKWLPLVLVGFFFRALVKLTFDRRIQVIHMQDAVQAPIGWLLSKLTGRPYLVVAHGLDITFKKAFYQQLILPFVRKADAVVSISSATEQEVLKRGVSKKKSFVITLGTLDDYNDPKPNRSELAKKLHLDLNGKFLLITTGRLVKRKGVAWFIENVLPQLVKESKNVLYLVAGDGAEKEAISESIRRTKMSKYVKMLGRVDDDVRSLLYQSADTFVMPNIVVPGDMEGFGIVAHEAATAAIPVVASNLEGIADALVDQKNGILVETGDSAGFVRELSSLMKMSSKKRSELGKQFRSFTLREYSWSVIAKKYKKVYDKLAGKTS